MGLWFRGVYLTLLAPVFITEIKLIKGGLLFLVANDFVKVNYEGAKQAEPWVKWLNETKQLEAAYENDVWNPKPNFSCRQYCAVVNSTQWEESLMPYTKSPRPCINFISPLNKANAIFSHIFSSISIIV